MCLGVPGRVTETYDMNGLLMGRVDFGGSSRETCLSYVPEVEVGEYVIVHVGFAISVVSEEDAQETLQIISEMMALEDEIGPEPAAA
jgi:hydrogenase expression/formation protein HypC